MWRQSNIKRTIDRRFVRSLVWIGSLVVSIALTQCQAPLTVDERLGLLVSTDLTCTLPCWNGIVPGTTTENEFRRLSEALPQERIGSLKRNDFGLGGVQYVWRDQFASFLADLSIAQGVVSYIRLRPEEPISLNETFKALGQPGVYTAYLSRGERFEVILNLIYQTRGTIIAYTVPEQEVKLTSCHFALTGVETVDQILLIEPGPAEEIIQNHLLRFHGLTLEPQVWRGSDKLELDDCEGTSP